MTALEIITAIEALELDISDAKKVEIVKEVLAHPERGEEIYNTLDYMQNESRINEEYLEGGMESVIERENARKAAKAAAEKQAKDMDNRIRKAALANIMAAEGCPVYGTPEFDAAFQTEYKRLKEGKNLTFEPAGTAFVYDCELSKLTPEQRALVEKNQLKARAANKIITKMVKALPDGAHYFQIVDIKQKEVNGIVREYLTLEEEETGYKAWLNWIVDERADSRDYRFTREYQLQKYSDANGDLFAGMDEETALSALKRSGFKGWSFTEPDAQAMDDGRKFARIYLTEDQYNYAVNAYQRRAAGRFDYQQRKNETKATFKF